MLPSTSAVLSADGSLQDPTVFHTYIYLIDKVYYIYVLAKKVKVLYLSYYHSPHAKVVTHVF